MGLNSIRNNLCIIHHCKMTIQVKMLNCTGDFYNLYLFNIQDTYFTKAEFT